METNPVGNGRRLQGKGPGGPELAMNLATLSVADTGVSATTLATANVRRPCYLVGLQAATPSSTVSINLGPAPSINGRQFATATTYEATFAVGQVHTIALRGINAHPFHLHVRLCTWLPHLANHLPYFGLVPLSRAPPAAMPAAQVNHFQLQADPADTSGDVCNKSLKAQQHAAYADRHPLYICW